MNGSPRILVIGANGQLGTELSAALADRYGADNVVGSDRVEVGRHVNLRHEMLDATDVGQLTQLVERHRITQIYHLAAALSATGETEPEWAWRLNMGSLLNVLEVERQHKLDKVFWPSSIAAFGPTTPAEATPQRTVMEPSTVYGISKLAGEGWCRWYHENHGVDGAGLHDRPLRRGLGGCRRTKGRDGARPENLVQLAVPRDLQDVQQAAHVESPCPLWCSLARRRQGRREMIDLGNAMLLDHLCELACVRGIQHLIAEIGVSAQLEAVAAHHVVRAVAVRQSNREFSAQLPVGTDNQNARRSVHATTPSSLPACAKALNAASSCARVCCALIWTRMRAWPLGTTG